MPVLSLIDVCSIQKFIFSSNRLADIVANSQLVEWATSEDGALSGCNEQIIRAAGGNALLKFPTLEEAKTFTAAYSRKVFEAMPAIEIAFAHHEYAEGTLADAIETVYGKIEKIKNARRPAKILPGLGVTLNCSYTGLPATDFDKNSRAVVKKDLPHIIKSKLLDKNYVKDELYTFTSDFDKLGRTKNDTSYLGIVHIDGNAIGKKIQKWLKEMQSGGQSDAEVIENYKKIASGLANVMCEAFENLCIVLKQHIKPLEKSPWVMGDFENLNFTLRKEDNKTVLPIRPVIIGGDDLTFVCDGRLALSLTQKALEKISQSSNEILGKIGACAGVAFIKSHSPFSRGYELAQDLCSRAKKDIYLNPDKYSHNDCLIDWHIGNIRPGQSIEEVRATNYSNLMDGKSLTNRPYVLNFTHPESPGNWFWISENVLGKHNNAFRSDKWFERRNKIKKMVSVLKNSKSTDDFSELFEQIKISDDNIALPSGIDVNGKTKGTPNTSIIDAVEILDMHQSFSK